MRGGYDKLRYGLAIEMAGQLGSGLDGKLGGAVEEGLAELRIVEVFLKSEGEGLGDLIDLIGIELSAEGTYDFGDGSGVGAGNGDAAGHRFESGQAKSFVEAGQDYK